MNIIFKNKSPKNTYFFLSPHLDDAVFSCVGLIAKVTASGFLAEVITFYTKQNNPELYPPDLLRSVKKLTDYNTRQKEDIAALTLLKAKLLHLDYIDRFFRPPWLTNGALAAGFFTPLFIPLLLINGKNDNSLLPSRIIFGELMAAAWPEPEVLP